MTPRRRRQAASSVDAVRAVENLHMNERQAIAARAERMAAALEPSNPPASTVAGWFRELAIDLRRDPIRRGRPT